MKTISSLLLLNVFSTVLGQFFKNDENYILTSRSNVQNAVIGLPGLELLATFEEATFDEGLIFYKAKGSLVNKYRDVLLEMFDIEEDVQLSINYNKNNNQKIFGPLLSAREVPWNLNRITKVDLDYDNTFPYYNKGSCHNSDGVVIDTYIVDTGIDITHTQFEGRASWGANFVDNLDTDCNKHGTHVAGTIGSRDYGVCVDANLIAVKVLDCNGSGSLSGVIKGIEWVYKRHKENGKFLRSSNVVKSIINMSLGGGYSAALNRVVDYCIENDDNFYIVVAAGNENEDACGGSPSSSPNVMTVMASDRNDIRAWFSNWGKCGDIYGPGVNVLSTVPKNGTDTFSGTSMASPCVAGVLNHYLDMYPGKNMEDIKRQMKKDANKNMIKNNKKKNTLNLSVYLHRN